MDVFSFNHCFCHASGELVTLENFVSACGGLVGLVERVTRQNQSGDHSQVIVDCFKSSSSKQNVDKCNCNKNT